VRRDRANDVRRYKLDRHRRFDFLLASRSAVANLSAALSKAITTVAALSAEGVNDGVLGAKLRAKVTSTGTYAGNTSVAVYIGAR
jgi:hypothetical protein